MSPEMYAFWVFFIYQKGAKIIYERLVTHKCIRNVHKAA